MRLCLYNTPSGLKPCYDEDWEEKRKLRLGEYYTAEIKLQRNPRFHRLYFALIGLAWDYLPERSAAFFKTKENFRKYVEVAAGCCETMYHPALREWIEIPKSVSFDSMDETEFRDVYGRVRDVLFKMLGKWVSAEEFERNLMQF